MNKEQEFSQIAQDIRDSEMSPSSDYIGKLLFRNKEVLSFILHELIDEYKLCSLADIRDIYLEQNVMQLNEKKVDKTQEAEPSPPQLTGVTTESINQYGKGIEYDVLLMLPVPDKPDERVGVIINIELQNKIRKRKGHFIKRMIYYAAKLITDQKGTLFYKDNYENLRKVYSLWLCPMSGSDAPVVDLFEINVKRIFGKHKTYIPKDFYDLLKLIHCQFNIHSKCHSGSVQRFLQLLLTACAPVEKRLNELHDDYGITITEESSTMGNLTYGLYMMAKQETIRKYRKKWVKIGEARGVAIGEAIGEAKCKTMRLEIYRNLKAEAMDDNAIMKILHITSEQLNELQEIVDAETISASTSEPLLQDS